MSGSTTLRGASTDHRTAHTTSTASVPERAACA